MRKIYKYVIACEITVIARNSKEAKKLIKDQCEVVNREGDPWGIESSKVEADSKYNKIGRAKRVKFCEE